MVDTSDVVNALRDSPCGFGPKGSGLQAQHLPDAISGHSATQDCL